MKYGNFSPTNERGKSVYILLRAEKKTNLVSYQFTHKIQKCKKFAYFPWLYFHISHPNFTILDANAVVMNCYYLDHFWILPLNQSAHYIIIFRDRFVRFFTSYRLNQGKDWEQMEWALNHWETVEIKQSFLELVSNEKYVWSKVLHYFGPLFHINYLNLFRAPSAKENLHI